MVALKYARDWLALDASLKCGTSRFSLVRERDVVEVKYCGQIGNQLFQYCLGRIIAERLGFELFAPPIPGFPGTFEKVSGANYRKMQTATYRGQTIDMTSILADKSPRHIILEGYFQRYEYFQEHETVIKKVWLKLPDDSIPLQPVEDVLVHVRRGDYLTKYYWALLPFSFYTRLLDSMMPATVRIVTDSPDDPFVRRLAQRYVAPVTSGDPLTDFALLASSRNIILSQSTYAWWAGYLSSAARVYYPIPITGYWSLHSEIDLRVLDPRYEYVRCTDVYRMTLREVLLYYRWPPTRLVKELAHWGWYRIRRLVNLLRARALRIG